MTVLYEDLQRSSFYVKKEEQNVTDEEIAVKLTALEHETKSAKHRLDDLEVQNQAIQDLALSVKELTINMTRMMEEQEKQGQDIDILKSEPAKRWKDSTKALFNAALGAIGAAFGVGIIYLIAQYLQI